MKIQIHNPGLGMGMQNLPSTLEALGSILRRGWEGAGGVICIFQMKLTITILT
jgi:hypothetical protein